MGWEDDDEAYRKKIAEGHKSFRSGPEESHIACQI